MLNINQQEALWLVENYNKIRQFGKVSSWIGDHVRAMSIIKGTQVSVPGCNCKYSAYARMANSMFEQNIEAIKTIAYPPQIEVIDDQTGTNPIVEKRSRGRSKKNTEG